MAACPPCRSARSANESCPEGEKEAIEGGGDNRTEGGGLEWTRNEDRGEGGKKEEEEERERKREKKEKGNHLRRVRQRARPLVHLVDLRK